MSGGNYTPAQRQVLSVIDAWAVRYPGGLGLDLIVSESGRGRFGVIKSLQALRRKGVVIRHKNHEGRVRYMRPSSAPVPAVDDRAL